MYTKNNKDILFFNKERMLNKQIKEVLYSEQVIEITTKLN